DTALHDVAAAVELTLFLALRNIGACARTREEGRNSSTSSADPFRQRTLRVEFDLKLTREILLREQLVLADIGRNHFLHLTRLEQESESGAVDACIVGNDRQILHAVVTNGLDQGLGNSAEAKASAADQHAVLEQACQRGLRVGIDFFH